MFKRHTFSYAVYIESHCNTENIRNEKSYLCAALEIIRIAFFSLCDAYTFGG